MMVKRSHSRTNNSKGELNTTLTSMCDEKYITSNAMKFAIFAVAALVAKFAAAESAPTVGSVNLKDLGFVLWGPHAEGTVDKTKCPLGTLPDRVFLHKTVKHGDHFFTWVKPVHGLVNELVCDSHAVWKGLAGELLLDFHFFGKAAGVKLVHLEHLTALGGVAHVFLKFEGTAAGKAVGHAVFVKEVAALMDAAFLNVKALPAHALLHELAFHHAA
ncbi:hypothetical protein MACK_003822 [Theileria orientalis]|uniref:Uncharacterized protein n=1 Tax=Theileria orientalis TaxID=68886 RepID=A0A976SIY9_THEOR|nr:hypothetical protein MACK_003822 [Theileria orientalis]